MLRSMIDVGWHSALSTVVTIAPLSYQKDNLWLQEEGISSRVRVLGFEEKIN
jgi:hypothetical protein